MRPGQLIRTKAYSDAKSQIAKWKGLLEKGGKSEALKVRDEKAEFFFDMQKSNPGLYSIFKLDDKVLSEIIYKKLTGSDIILG